jgi:putative tricarboxylic transport membrane protein
MHRRTLINSIAATLLTSALSMTAWAQSGPFDTIKIMVPAGPGGGFDQTGRSLGAALQAGGLAKSVQYENKGGAGGTIGLAQFLNVDKASSNALIVAGLVTVGAVQLNKTPVSLANVTPIARLLAEAEVVAVPASSKIVTIQDLRAALKANPGAVAFAGGSAGGTDHLLAGMLVREAGADPSKTNYVAFTSGAEAVSAVLGGHVAAGISGVGEFLPHIKSGRLRAIAVSSAQRLPDVNIPTLRELGVDIELVNWRGIFAGPGITEAQRDHLAKAVEAAVKTPSWKQSLDKLEWLEFYQPGKDFGPFIESEQKRVALIIESLGLGRK